MAILVANLHLGGGVLYLFLGGQPEVMESVPVDSTGTSIGTVAITSARGRVRGQAEVGPSK